MAVGEKVKVAIERLKRSTPDDITVDTLVFQPDEVGKSILSFMSNLSQGRGFGCTGI